MTLAPPELILGNTHFSRTGLRTHHLVAATHSRHHLNQIRLSYLIRPYCMVAEIYVSSLHVFSKLFVGFLEHHIQKSRSSGVNAIPVKLMQYAGYGQCSDQLTHQYVQPLQQCCRHVAAILAAFTCLFTKEYFCLWRWKCTVNLFVWLWCGLFWVEPVQHAYKNRWIALTFVLPLRLKVLTIFL